ncbi:glycosyltransferase [Microbacterium sp.]|uniref:glycosyltransferase n=1 Tax=Microbacterium sp. TaxID=51671 RepID=UPI00334093A4
MPARAHAILITRTGDDARAQLRSTLQALRAQTTPPHAITLVVTGPIAHVRPEDGFPGVEGVIETRVGTSFAEAVELARPRVAAGDSIWLLAQDTRPAPDALEHLAGALERSPSAALAAPKLVRHDDDREIVSLGVSMTRLGRAVELASDELDQGQHDGNDDALGADIRGTLVRGEVRESLRPDTALAGADEGLDLGVRARLGGWRVVLSPAARVEVRPDGPAALPRREAHRAWATRTAQLHRRLSYAPAPAVPLHWLSLLPLALWRTITHLIGKRPASVAPEWGAALTEMFRFGAVTRSRRAIRGFRTSSWSGIAPLRVSRADLHRRLDDGHGSEGGATGELRFFSGGGAWAVLAALVVAVAAFTLLLAWPAIGGGGLLPLRETVAGLWADAAWGRRGVGLQLVGPADPFAGVLAVLGSLWPGAPSFAMVLLWILALPLAVLGGWFAATRVTDRSGLRILGGVAWALAPTFLTALIEGRPAAVLVHLLLPWLFHAATVAHRSWGAAGAASLFAAAVLACSPSLAPAVVLLWIIALVVVLSLGRVRGAVRLLWVLIPSVAMFAPLVYAQVRRGDPLALLADPGAIWAGPQAAADAAGRAVLATGFPTSDLAGWTTFLNGSAVWVPFLLAPIALLALFSAVSPRWYVGIVLLVVSVTGIATAFAAVGVSVSFAQGAPVAIWPGAALSLAWIGVTGAALVALDTARPLTRVRGIAGLIVGAALVVCAVPALTAVHRDAASITNGPERTLPAFVAAQSGEKDAIGTLVLTPKPDGALAADVVWGSSATLGAQTTLASTATAVRDDGIPALAVDLLSARDFDAAAALAKEGISFVLLAEPADTDRAQALHADAEVAIDQRPGLVKAGTERGVLWRLDATAAAREDLTGAQHTVARIVTLLQLIVVLAALLLSIPTRASRRAVRAGSRIVGRAPEEPLVLPRRKARPGERDTAPIPPGPVAEQGAADTDSAPDAPDAGSSADAAAPEEPAVDVLPDREPGTETLPTAETVAQPEAVDAAEPAAEEAASEEKSAEAAAGSRSEDSAAGDDTGASAERSER